MGDLYWVPGTRLTPVRSRRLSKSEEILPLASTWSVQIFKVMMIIVMMMMIVSAHIQSHNDYHDDDD